MKVFEVIATKRSGHHAIISWIVKNLTGMNLSLHHKDNDGKLQTIKMEYINEKILHWNDASNDQDFGLKLFKESHLYGSLQNLIVNYEDVNSDYSFFFKNEKFMGPLSVDRFLDIQVQNTKRIVVIRDFYNCIASRYQQKKDGLFPHNTSTEFIEIWKNNAKFVLENPKNYIKYEDWLSNKEIRNNILNDYFDSYEVYDPKTINGRGSSFDDKNFNQRHLQIDLPEETKELISRDSELHYLIGALGYEYKKF